MQKNDSNKTARVLKKIGKIFLWLLGVIIFLLIAIVFLIRLESVQNFIIKKATTYVSDRTHTRVQIGHIKIGFPKEVILENVFLDDPNKDTLLSAGLIGINLEMFGLLKHRLNVDHIRMEDMYATIFRKSDSTFNYSFLIEAFASDSGVKVTDTSSKPMDISLDKVSLSNIRLNYSDSIAGNSMNAVVGKLQLTINKFNVPDVQYHADKLELQNSSVTLTTFGKSEKTDTGSSKSPDIKLNELLVENFHFISMDITNGDLTDASIGNCKIKSKDISLPQSKVELESVLLENATVRLVTHRIEKKETTASNSPMPWKISSDKIALVKADFRYDVSNKGQADGFDANHIHITDFNTDINSVLYSESKISSQINKLSFQEKCGFKMINFHSNFLFDDHKIELSDLLVHTPNSKIGSYASISFTSLDEISKSIGRMGIKLELRDSYVSTTDLTTILPAFKKQKLFAGPSRTIRINTTVHGKVNDITIPDLMVTAGKRTKLKASMHITGLPDAQSARYDLEVPYLETGKQDVAEIMNGTIPSDIIPATVYLNTKFHGTLKNFNGDLDVKSSLGNFTAAVRMMPGSENYSATLEAKEIKLGEMLKDTSLGSLSMTANVNGTSFDMDKAIAKVTANISEVEFRKYVYKGIDIDGKVANRLFEGRVSINDTNLAFAFDGKVNLNKGKEQYAFNLDLKGADLKNLHFSEKDIRLSAKAEADLKGGTMNTFNGKAGVTNLLVIKEGKTYSIDSLLFASVNETGKSSFAFKSSIIAAKFNGTFVPGDLGKVINYEINRYFDIGDTTSEPLRPQDFSFEITINNHPLLREVLLPGLEEFQTVKINGSLDSRNRQLSLTADIPRIKYSGLSLNNTAIDVKGDGEKINYAFNIGEASNATIKIISTSLFGTVSNDEAGINLLMKDSNENEKIYLNARLTSMREGDYHFTILPDGLSLNKNKWSVPSDNFVRFGTNGLLFNHFELTNNEQYLGLHTPAQKIAEDITVEFKKFQLFTISQLIEKDSSLVNGELTGTFKTRKTESYSAFTADLKISALSFKEIPIGDVTLQANNPGPEKYNASLLISGNDNNVKVDGSYFAGKNPELDIRADISPITLKTVSAFSNGMISNPSGNIKGNVSVKGSPSAPVMQGEIEFDNAGFHSSTVNNYFRIKNEKISFDPKGIYFSRFEITDSLRNPAVISGTIAMNNFSIENFNLELLMKNFTALNTEKKKNSLFYGKLTLNSTTKISGTPALPKAYSKTKLVEGSNMTVVVPETKASTDKGEGVVVFTDPNNKISPILTREQETDQTKSEIRGIDLSADVEIDKKSTLKILIDPTSGDSLVLKGDATLSFGIDPSGKTSLTGTYTLSEGSYRVSLQGLIKRDFAIKSGSTIVWNGDPLEADINIEAVHEQNTSPIDLVAGQIGGLSEQEKNTYKQKIPFQVILHMTGPLLKPILTFQIDMPSKYRGAMGGTVYAKINQLNNDPSELNKQVFALLVLGRFVQEDPLASDAGGGGLGSVARTSVSKFLSSQLNKFSGRYIKGVELDFDLQSYDDYSTGTAEEKTKLDLIVKKQFFNDRVTVIVGNTVDISKNDNQNNANELASDVTIEYTLGDGTYKLKAFRQNQYDDVIEGPLNVTGFGVVYSRDFDIWKDLFRKEKKEEDVIIPLKED